MALQTPTSVVLSPLLSCQDYQGRWKNLKKPWHLHPLICTLVIISCMGMEHSLILELNATLAEIPLLTDNSPACWKHGLNVMLEKVQGTTMWKTMDNLTF